MGTSTIGKTSGGACAAERVNVNVNEAGNDDLVRGVDDPARRRVDVSRNCGNLIAAYADLPAKPGTACAVDTRAFLI